MNIMKNYYGAERMGLGEEKQDDGKPTNDVFLKSMNT